MDEIVDKLVSERERRRTAEHWVEALAMGLALSIGGNVLLYAKLGDARRAVKALSTEVSNETDKN